MTTNMYNVFLNKLRESGQINMFMAPVYLMSRFGLSKAQAREVFTEWTKTFEDNKK